VWGGGGQVCAEGLVLLEDAADGFKRFGEGRVPVDPVQVGDD